MNAEKKHQMETFEFLTLCRAHNFTKILGVVTHLDQMKTTKLKKKKKKMLKMRFWTEVCQVSYYSSCSKVLVLAPVLAPVLVLSPVLVLKYSLIHIVSYLSYSVGLGLAPLTE